MNCYSRILRIILTIQIISLIATFADASSSSSTAFGPFKFSSSIPASKSATSPFSYSHFTLPADPTASSTNPTLLPVLVGPDYLSVKLSSKSFPSCSFIFCATNLIAASEQVSEWSRGLQQNTHDAADTGVTDLCQGYFNLTAGTSSSSSFSTNVRVQPGLTHFAVYALNHAPATGSSLSSDACEFDLQLSGRGCPDGSYGDNCDITPPFTTAQSKSLTASLSTASDAVVYFEVHPMNIYATALQLNITSSKSGEGFNVFVHEGDLPSVAVNSPIFPRTDLNGTSTDGSPLTVTIPFPSYRVNQQQNRRYFVGVTRTDSKKKADSSTSISLSVVHELACPTGYHGPNCEYFVEFLLDPFELSSILADRISANAFQWNMHHTEIWYYFGLIFLNVEQAQNFSLGLQAIGGQPLPPLYFRMGAIPTLTQYDMKLANPAKGELFRFYESGTTLLHDATWFVGVNVPPYFSLIDDVGIWINSACPATTRTTRIDGSVKETPCSNHGVCIANEHRCACVERWTGWDCKDVDASMGLTAMERALIVVVSLALTFALGWFLCYRFDQLFRRRGGNQGDYAPPPQQR